MSGLLSESIIVQCIINYYWFYFLLLSEGVVVPCRVDAFTPLDLVCEPSLYYKCVFHNVLVIPF